MISRIFVDNFRCFTNFELYPERINLLLGRNGAGKSSLYDVLRAVAWLVRVGSEVEREFPLQSLTRWDSRARQRVELDVEGNGGRYRYHLVVRQELPTRRTSIEEERVTFDQKTLYSYSGGAVQLHDNDGAPGATFPFRGTRSFLAQIDARPESKDLHWFLRFLHGLWPLRLDARHMRGTSVREEEELRDDGSNFASWYRHLTLEAPDRLQPYWDALARALPGFRGLALHSVPGGARDLVVKLSTGTSTYEVAFEELSDGQRALIVLYGLLCAGPEQACLILDEPEAHVGLTEVQPWLVELDDRFQDQGQLFIISQHPQVVDYFAASAPFLLDRPDEGPVRVRPAPLSRAGGLTASSQLARGLVDG